MKIPWTTGNYISNATCKGWITPYIEFFVANGIKQVRVKAGCKVYYPDGLDSNNNPKYSIYTLTTDAVSNWTSLGTGSQYIFLGMSNSTLISPSYVRCSMGATPELSPSNPNNIRLYWWDTTNNIIKYSDDNGTNWDSISITLPIAWINLTPAGVDSLIPFEFCGCMGNNSFALPQQNIIGQGLNSDGSPNNATFNVSSIVLTTSTLNADGVKYIKLGPQDVSYYDSYFIQDTEPTGVTSNQWWYKPSTNENFFGYTGSWALQPRLVIAQLTWNNTNKRITNFKPFTNIDSLVKYYSVKKPWTVGNYVSQYGKRLDFELKNGILTLKAGSKVYVPDGLDSNNNPVYSDYTLTSDSLYDGENLNATDVRLLHVRTTDGKIFSRLSIMSSIGSSPSVVYTGSPSSYRYWWDTDNNVMKQSNDLGSTWTNVPISLPIGVVVVKPVGVIASFSPFHFVGHMGNGVFVLPNFTLNFPNGRDSSGEGLVTPVTCTTINSKSYTVSSNVSNGTVSFNKNTKLVDMLFNNNVYYQDTAPANPAAHWYWYNTLNNTIKYCNNSLEWVDTNWGFIGNFTWDGSTKSIMNFKPFTNIDSLATYYG